MDYESLRFALENGIIDLTIIQKQVGEMKKQAYLDKHKYNIWKDTSGRWTTYLPTESGRKLVKKKSKEKLLEVIIEYYRFLDGATRFEKVFEEWIAYKLDRLDIQQQSVDKYRATFIRHIKNSKLNQCDIDEITSDTLEKFIIDTIKRENLSAKGWADLRLVIRGTFKYAYKKKYTTLIIDQFLMELDLSPNIFKKRNRDADKNVFTDEEVKQIQNHILQRKNITVIDLGILLAFETGLRAGEMIALKFSDFDEENETLSINRTEVRAKDEKGKHRYTIREHTKGKVGYRTVILLPDGVKLMKMLRNLNTDSEYCFQINGSQRHSCIFTNRLYRICDSLGIQKRSLHKCRKTFATNMINNQVPEVLVMSQMGHTDISTTKAYYYFNNMSLEQEKSVLKELMTKT